MMKSNKAYLIRAFNEWILDNNCTPYLVVNSNFPRCQVPQEFAEDGQITLNISPDAIRDLIIGNEILEFRASFSGIVHIISVPIKAILAVYAHENGQGMFFDFEEENETEWGAEEPSERVKTPVKSEAKKRSSHLTLVE